MISKPIMASILVAVFLLMLALFWFVGIFSPPASTLLGLPADQKLSRVKMRFREKVIDAEVTLTPAERAKGLGYRDSLGQDQGMLFLFRDKAKHSFWMQGMRFPLDFIWLDGETVVDITENVVHPALSSSLFPQSIAPSVPVNRVLEVNAGFVRLHEIKVGDRLTVSVE